MWVGCSYTARAVDSGWAYGHYSPSEARPRGKSDELEQPPWLVASPALGTATNQEYAAPYRILIALP